MAIIGLAARASCSLGTTSAIRNDALQAASSQIRDKPMGPAPMTANQSDFCTIALRPTAIWGPGDAFAKALPDAIAGGRFALIDRGDYPYATTHVDNVAEAVKLALRAHSGGRASFVADREVMTFGEFIAMIAETHGETIAGLRSIPYWLASLVGRGMELAWGIMHRKEDPPM